jgi:hypothetical protein
MFLVQFEGQFTQHVFLVCCFGGCFEKQTVCKFFFVFLKILPGYHREKMKKTNHAKALLGWKALAELGLSSAHILPTLYKFQEWVLNLDP